MLLSASSDLEKDALMRHARTQSCRDVVGSLLAAAISVGAPFGTGAWAKDIWVKDPINGCALWSDQPAAAGELVSWAGACKDGRFSCCCHGARKFLLQQLSLIRC